MKSFAEISKQISALTIEAEKVRKMELKTAIKDIKEKIAVFGLTAEDLGLNNNLKSKNPLSKRTKAGTKTRRENSKPKKKIPPKYADGLGNTWTGRGKQPLWVKSAINAGKSIESFLVHRQQIGVSESTPS